MKRIYFVILGVLLSVGLVAQNNLKLDVGLIHLQQEQKDNTLKTTKANETISVFVYGNTDNTKYLVEDLGGHVNTVTKEILTATIPANKIDALAKYHEVERIQLSRPVQSANNKAIENISADRVHNGDGSLDRAYKGKNVVVGIIDSGIDYLHTDFRDPADQSKSRVLYLWDQNDAATTGQNPSGFSYGAEWNKQQIETAIANNGSSIPQKDDESGHGTHVAGTAAGNAGIAPEAKIIFVSLNFSNSAGIADAAKYIFEKADELGLPCVINASLGGHYAPHDGTDPEGVMIDEMVKAKPGRAFVAAAGNEGSDFIHFSHDLNTSEAWTWYYGAFTGTSFVTQLYGVMDRDDAETTELAISLDSTYLNFNTNEFKPVKSMGTSDYNKVSDLFGIMRSFTFTYGDEAETTAGTIKVTAGVMPSNPNKVEFLVIFNDAVDGSLPNYGWDFFKVHFKGTATPHVWTLRGNSVPFPSNLGVDVPENFFACDNSYSVGSPATAKEIIAVGASVNRVSWQASAGTVSVTNPAIKVGDLANFSSEGPTLDLRTKPEIVAPGQFVMSALSHWVTVEEDAANDVSADGIHWIMSGTSMASPVVTGAVALMLEKNPELNITEIRDLLFNNTDKDEFTGENLPNNLWGHGKLNIFNTMMVEQTDIEDINEENKLSLIEGISPNPVKNIATIDLSNTNNSNGYVQILNLIGDVVYQETIKSGQDQLVWNSEDSSAGIYLCKVHLGGKTETIKIVKK